MTNAPLHAKRSYFAGLATLDRLDASVRDADITADLRASLQASLADKRRAFKGYEPTLAQAAQNWQVYTNERARVARLVLQRFGAEMSLECRSLTTKIVDERSQTFVTIDAEDRYINFKRTCSRI